MDAISIISIFLFESIQFTIYYYLNRFLHMFKIFQLTEQNMYVQVTYTNPAFSTYVLHKRHGHFFGSHSRIFFVNSEGDTILFNSVGKMFHIFGPKLDTVSEPQMTALILLPCNVVLFLRLQLLSFWGNISVNISVVMFVFTLNISFAREVVDEKSLYTKPSAFLCNPLMRLFNVLLRFFQTNGH